MSTHASGLSTAELNYIADTLGGLVDEFVSHSCNDWLVPATPENKAILAAANAYNRANFPEPGNEPPPESPPEINGNLFIYDYELMRFLSYKCKQIALSNAPESPPARLSEHEAMRIAELLDMLHEDWSKLFDEEFEIGCEDDSLPATAENKALVTAIIRYADPKDAQDRLNNVAESGDTVATFCLWAIRYLAHRCRETKGNTGAPSRGAAAAQHACSAKTTGAPKIERLGLARSWNTEKSLIKQFRGWDTFAELREKSENALEAYGSGQNPFRDYFEKTKPKDPPHAHDVVSAFLSVGQWQRRLFAISVYSHDPEDAWTRHLEKATAYWYWRQSVEAIARISGIWKGRASLGNIVEVIADCLVLGWIGEAKTLTSFARSLYERHAFMDVAGKEFNGPLDHWLLRICFDHWDMPFSGWGSAAVNIYSEHECFGKPVLNELAANWSLPDLSPLNDHLIWLCDYHTFVHAGGLDKNARFPAIILAWFRLREALGLQYPEIDHPLLKANYAKLPSIRPFYTDPLLKKALARLRGEEMPALGSDPDLPIRP